jgi:hypothetical protein
MVKGSPPEPTAQVTLVPAATIKNCPRFLLPGKTLVPEYALDNVSLLSK